MYGSLALLPPNNFKYCMKKAKNCIDYYFWSQFVFSTVPSCMPMKQNANNDVSKDRPIVLSSNGVRPYESCYITHGLGVQHWSTVFRIKHWFDNCYLLFVMGNSINKLQILLQFRAANPRWCRGGGYWLWSERLWFEACTALEAVRTSRNASQDWLRKQ